MVILIHVIFALSSLALSTLAVILPSSKTLRASYALAAATIASGTYVALSQHARLISACISGLLYLAVVMSQLAFARKRLAADTNTN